MSPPRLGRSLVLATSSSPVRQRFHNKASVSEIVDYLTHQQEQQHRASFSLLRRSPRRNKPLCFPSPHPPPPTLHTLDMADLLPLVDLGEVESPTQESVSCVRKVLLDVEEPEQVQFFAERQALFKNVQTLVVKIKGRLFSSPLGFECCDPPAEALLPFLQQVTSLVIVAKTPKRGVFRLHPAWMSACPNLQFLNIDANREYLPLSHLPFPPSLVHLKLSCSIRPFLETPESLQVLDITCKNCELYSEVPHLKLTLSKRANIFATTIAPFSVFECTVVADSHDPSQNKMYRFENGPHTSIVSKEGMQVSLRPRSW